MVTGTEGDDLLIGQDGEDWLQAGGGNDELRAGGGNDIVEGNAGRDRMLGGAGNDIYLYCVGDGVDRISDGGGGDTADRIVFGPGITPESIVLTASQHGEEVIVTFAGGNAGDVIILSGQLFAQQLGIDGFTFADGTSWSRAEILARMSFAPVSPTTQNGAAADETILGGFGDDTLGGGGGTDLLKGGFGADSYHFNLGDGHDEIVDQGSILDVDTIVFGAGITPASVTLTRSLTDPSKLILSLNASDSVTISTAGNGWGDGIERIVFADGTVRTITDLQRQYLGGTQTTGNDTVVGFDASETVDTVGGNDTLAGGKGDDFLKGAGGNESYRFNLGDGHDIISDTGGIDTLQFGAGIGPNDIHIALSNTDSDSLILTLPGTRDGVTLHNQLTASYTIEQFTFADGTVWTSAQLLDHAKTMQQTAFDDRIVGFATNDTLNGGAGDDRLYGGGGSDSLTGGAGNDTLIDDGLTNETYVYNPGNGDDLIIDDYGADRVVLGAGISASDVVLTRSIGDECDLRISFQNMAGSITIQDQFASGSKGIEEIAFSDGTVWNLATIRGVLTANAQTASSDRIVGFASNDTLSGGAGDDRIYGKDGDDTLTGGTGNDTLIDDGQTNETYVYNSGDGNDLVIDNAGTDRLVLGAGISASDVILARSIGDENDLKITFQNMAGSITFQDQFYSSAKGIDEIAFSDGTVWSRLYIQTTAIANSPTVTISGTTLADTIVGTALNEHILANAGNDVIRGGAGNDYIEGYSGNDRYLFDLGDGQDIVYGFSGSDSLEFGAGIAPSDIIVERDPNNATYCILKIAGTADQVAISAVGQVKFQDGTVWTEAQAHQRYVDQTVSADGDFIDTSFASAGMTVNAGAGADRIYTEAGGDVIRGGTGNDYAESGAGNDRYLFDLGDGEDVFNGETGTDTVEFGAGIDPSDITVRRDETNTNYLVLQVAGTSDQLSIQGVETILFANGVSWTVSALAVEPLLSATGVVKLFGDSQDNQLIGTSGDDVFTGKAGNDALIGSSGSDVFNFARGEGRDTIIDDGAASFTDALVLGAGILPSDILVQAVANHPNDLLLVIKGTEDAIYLADQLAGNGSGLEQVRFANGTVWTRTDIVATDLVSQSTSGNDTIYGSIFADTISGGLGADVLKGSFGSDTYQFNAGDGQDTIVDLGGLTGDNTLSLGSGLLAANLLVQRASPESGDLVVRFSGSTDQVTVQGQFSGGGVATLAFHDGTTMDRAAIQSLVLQQATTTAADVINGFASDDTLTGGLGNDTLNGAAGGDTYVYASGDGSDVIDEGLGAGLDTLHFTNLNAADVSLAAAQNDANDLIVTIIATGETIRIDDQFATAASTNSGVDQFVFADSTTWNMASIAASTTFSFVGAAGNDTMNGGAYNDTIDGAAGDDAIQGNAGNDTLIGGLGNDTLGGDAGNDIFVFRPGAGLDTVSDFSAGSDAGDVIRLEGLGYESLNDVLAHAYQSGADTVIAFDASNKITLTGVTLTQLHENDFIFASA